MEILFEGQVKSGNQNISESGKIRKFEDDEIMATLNRLPSIYLFFVPIEDVKLHYNPAISCALDTSQVAACFKKFEFFVWLFVENVRRFCAVMGVDQWLQS